MSRLTAQQKYLFDLRGFIVLRNIIPSDDVNEARNAISENLNKFIERKGHLRNSKLNVFQGDRVRGRLDCGTMLTWNKPHCEVFRRFLALPKLVPILNELCGKGFRLDHLPLSIIQYKEAEGFDLHGGNVDGEGEWMPDLAYDCRYGKMRCNLLNVAIPLDATRAGDGGFVVIPGSHKANFPLPSGLAECDPLGPDSYLVNPTLNPGDVVIFTEAATHGALPWRGASESRRTLFYRYCPPNFAYGRAYYDKFEELSRELSPEERVVLQPPFVNRLDRLHLEDDYTVGITTRSEEKKQFDQGTYNNTYF